MKHLKKFLLIGVLIAIALYFLLVLLLEAIQLAIGGVLLFLVIYLVILNLRQDKKKKP
jgi:uncharacterized membrane protein